ncbi:MAG: flagellar motor switch protein FliN [Acidimicrobiales bacterium]|jgi:flagellar motor switch protein FliN/FliY|nr:flagellar motor switch protein FliN [Acidimicrobiales bacterium]
MTDAFPPDATTAEHAERPMGDTGIADGLRAEPRAAARSDSPMHRLGMISSIETEVSVVLGRARLPIRELLALGPGAILELDRKPNEPVEVLVNGTLVARGEVVVVDEDFGVRISEIVVQRDE